MSIIHSFVSGSQDQTLKNFRHLKFCVSLNKMIFHKIKVTVLTHNEESPCVVSCFIVGVSIMISIHDFFILLFYCRFLTSLISFLYF